MKKTTEKGKVKLFGRDIPLTKSGNPNKTYLTKDEKQLLEQFEEKQRKEKKELKLKDLETFFSSKK
jgi:hypothetical protein